MTDKKQRRRASSVRMALAAILLLTLPMPASPQSSNSMEASSSNTDFLTSNSRATIQAMERHLFSDEVQSRIERIFTSRVEYNGQVHTFPSFKYTFKGFWRNWERMMKDGIPTGSPTVGSGGVGGDGKFVLFAGDINERQTDIIRDPRNPRQPKRTIQIHGYEYGLANMAAFLSQVMVDGIHDDACDESNEQFQLDSLGNPTNYLPPENACGQYNATYAEMVCPPSEKEMECPPSPSKKAITASFATGKTSMKCGPDVAEGCCWWGRGPLHTKGLCNMGKVNYYLGKKALDEGRITYSTNNTYPDVDFCQNPEAVCLTNDEDMMWSVAMFEWANRIQQYSAMDDSKGESWNYKEKLVEFVNGGMNMFEYYSEQVDINRDNSFIHSVSSIVDKGCHNSPHCEPFGGVVHKLSKRRTAFLVALSVLNIPTIRTELVVEQALDHLQSKRDRMEENLLRYKRNGQAYQSQRYRFDDMYNSIYRFSRPYDASDISYPSNITYFYSTDHDPLYMGNPYVPQGHKYGLANIALFLANGLELSVEKDDTCDELNEHVMSGKLPISNACGQRGISYQHMVCPGDPDMACPVLDDMYITAVTADRSFGTAPALQCGPKSRIPSTGYWDPVKVMEESQISYANENARVDVEGCCWWSRGVLQTRGVCSFGRLNYYLGKRAADEGRDSLFPDVDFCANPESVCGSQYTHQLIWMSGLFEWVDRVQTYDKGGFNYMHELHKFADGGMKDYVFIKHVGAIVQAGCHEPPCESAGCLDFPCDGAKPVDENAGVTKAFQTFVEIDLWNMFPMTPGGTSPPSPSPTECEEDCGGDPSSSPLPPTGTPTESPFAPPTSVPSGAPTSLKDERIAQFEEVARELDWRKDEIESNIFVSNTDSGQAPSKLYTLDGFRNTLEDLATEGVNGKLFYIGQGKNGDSTVGLVNIALFLAHAMTRGILWDSCSEVNHHLVDGKLPLSNACGQNGRSYSDDICPLADAAMECTVDSSMNVAQASVGNTGAPPFFCGPVSSYPFTGYYDPVLDTTVSGVPFANAGGRVDVDSCCWWGRGILLNQGICDIGRFNFVYGLPALIDGRSSGRYNIDFCKHPEALCSDFTVAATAFNKFPTTIDTSEAGYLIGMLYWVDYVQQYSWGYWDYMEKLKLFVDGGMTDDSFIDEFSEIVLDSRHDGDLRKSNFKKVLGVLFMKVYTASPTKEPTAKPTIKPTRVPTADPIFDVANLPPGQTAVDGTAGTGPFGQNPVVGPNSQPGSDSDSNSNSIAGEDSSSDPNLQPAPTPKVNRPFSFDISNPVPSDSLPSNTIVDTGQVSGTFALTASGVGSLSFILFSIIFFC